MDLQIGRLQRALDHKVRRLRSMLTADEDIASELDRVVCRLMKLALRTSRMRQHPPPTNWMQCKLFDLLSLTEKAIDRRRKRFIENFPLNALEYEVNGSEMLAMNKLKCDDLSVNMLVDKYQNLVQSFENRDTAQRTRNKSNFGGFDFNEDLSDTSNEFVKEYEFVYDIENSNSASLIEPSCKSKTYERDYYTTEIEESKLQRIQAWVDEDLEVVPYPNHDVRLISSGDTDHSTTNMTRHKLKKMSRKRKLTLIAYPDKQETKIHKKSHPKTTENKTKTKIQEKNKKNKSKLFKKASPKRSSYCLLVKANLYKTSSNSFAKLRNKKVKEYPSPNLCKPIPDAYKELCHPDLNLEKKIEENMKYLTNIDRLNDPGALEISTNVATTKESLLVDIVMDGLEETIALRRTVGTDADEDPVEFEQEMVLGSLLNVMRNDSFCNKHDIETENVHSQTIFLNDINEPSTSKGVRHVSMDVQCGPDTSTPALTSLSAATSLTKVPKIFPAGIKIGESELELHSKLNSDFGTCTEDNDCNYKTITPRSKSVGIKIKDSDTNINMKTEDLVITPSDPNQVVISKETELIKPIPSGLKMEDSGSEYFGSVASYQKSQMILESSPEYISDMLLKSSTSKDDGLDPKFTSMQYVPPKLSRGGVYVHSYKDKKESEDVLYQGEWQRCRPKALVKKRVVFNTASARKLSDLNKKLRVNSKEKLHNIKSERKQIKLEQKILNPIQLRTQISQSLGKETDKKNYTINTKQTMKSNNRNGPKATTKLTISTLSTNNPKPVNTLKRPAILNATKKESETANKGNILPPESKTLRRIKNPVARNLVAKGILNKSIESSKQVKKSTKQKPIGKVTPLIRSKTEFIKKELLKFDDSPRDNISYVILRNESDNKSNKNSVTPKTNSTRRSDCTQRRNLSPQSQNSSTCSSPNSIATVRVAVNRSRVVANRKMSSSSNQDNMDSENVTPIRNKKFTKKNRIVKKTDANDLDNKENIPESSNGIKKETDGKCLNPFVTTRKSIYRAQVTTESALNSLSKHKTSTPIKPTLKNSNTEGIIPETLLKKDSRSPSLTSNDIGKTMSPPVSMTMFSWSTQLAQLEMNPLNSSLRTVNSPDKNMAMTLKKMIEDRLEFIRNSSDDSSSIDSKTVILSLKNLDENSSPDSYRTIINNEDLNNTLALRHDIENAVNRTFDLIADSKENGGDETELTDTDMLSFKTTTVASRASEYFLADNELDNFQASFSKNSVRDIFDRNETITEQNNDSPIASQAFSGFSINAVAGDQPEPINFLDSETGSMALDLAMQATSEEVFASGRSSGSYESCQYDDDALLPYWLFRINSQFVDEEEEHEPESPIPVELPEAFDMNGNVVAAGAGAGDGRGMHSDHSQDSSGRGTTSTTSSDPSSGVQSEAVLIDPSAFTGQFELPAVTVEIPEMMPLHEAGENIGEVVAPDRNGRRNPVVQLLATSDMDADVSSLDTDVQDSS